MLAQYSPNLNIYSITSPEETKESCLRFIFNVHVSYDLFILHAECLNVSCPYKNKGSIRELRVKLNDEIKWQLLDLHALQGEKNPCVKISVID